MAEDNEETTASSAKPSDEETQEIAEEMESDPSRNPDDEELKRTQGS